jgi:hypothetical protein
VRHACVCRGSAPFSSSTPVNSHMHGVQGQRTILQQHAVDAEVVVWHGAAAVAASDKRAERNALCLGHAAYHRQLHHPVDSLRVVRVCACRQPTLVLVEVCACRHETTEAAAECRRAVLAAGHCA